MEYTLYVLAFVAVIQGFMIKVLFARVEMSKKAHVKGAEAGIKLAKVLMEHSMKIEMLKNELVILLNKEEGAQK